MELNLKQIIKQRMKRIMWIANKTTEKIVKKELNKLKRDINRQILSKYNETHK